MKQIVVVLLLIAIGCSACSPPSSDPSQDVFQIAPSSPEQSDQPNSAVSLPENDHDNFSSFPAQEVTSMEPETSATPDYQGFTQAQWNELQSQKEKYGDLPKEERGMAAFNADIDCPEFSHLSWEHYIDLALIYHVGVDEFESWLKEIDSVNNADECNLYSFSKYFSISLDELVWLIETNEPHAYDLETVKKRYAYFIGDAQE